MRRSFSDRPCHGPNRREWLRIGLLSAWGLGLDEFLRLRARAAAIGKKEPKARACILIWLSGGPAHLDTFDPKPDAPAEIRGEFRPIETAVPGLWISEVLPNLADVMDKVALIRSVTTPEMDHQQATHHLLTGYRPSPALEYPGFGSVVARVRGSAGHLLPPYVAIPEAPAFSSSGYLTPAYDPFAVGGDPNADRFRVRDLTPPDRVTLDRLRRRRAMVAALDRFAQDVPPTPLTTSRDQFAAQAYDLLTSNRAQRAFKVDEELPNVRERYGRTSLGQACLMARRLVEAGVAFITINDRAENSVGWDTHVGNFSAIRETLAPPIDRGLSALIQDLAERGWLDSTLIVAMGEFGRTPRINPNVGRDHHGRAGSVLLAGGGLPGGVVVGKTDGNGDSPVERPVTPADLAATIYTALGIDPDRRFETPDGRPIRLVDQGKPIRELF